jgi:hypothetical protein
MRTVASSYIYLVVSALIMLREIWGQHELYQSVMHELKTASFLNNVIATFSHIGQPDSSDSVQSCHVMVGA